MVRKNFLKDWDDTGEQISMDPVTKKISELYLYYLQIELILPDVD